MTPDAQLDRLGVWRANVPRYTSYPTANHFSAVIGPDRHEDWIRNAPAGASISLYVHIPFCKRLCWFCACRTQGTTSDATIDTYLDGLLAEIARTGRLLPPGVRLSAVHWGGGTPTILSPDRITRLSGAIREAFTWDKDTLFSVEIDPTDVDEDRIAALAAAGMKRASVGVQDFDPQVQAAIGRRQSFETTARVIGQLRSHGIDSLNIDLLYGLPHQTAGSLRASIDKVLSLAPDRLALFGYAHVPWMSKRQRLIPEDALPGTHMRRDLLDVASGALRSNGYAPVGIDHFARPGDGLYKAQAEGRLRRNFQGYTDDQATTLLGLGASAISRFEQGYTQNARATHRYLAAIRAGHTATARGYAMTVEDQARSRFIESIMCRYAASLDDLGPGQDALKADLADRIHALVRTAPALIAFDGSRLRLLRAPELTARTVASRFDAHLDDGRHHSAAV